MDGIELEIVPIPSDIFQRPTSGNNSPCSLVMQNSSEPTDGAPIGGTFVTSLVERADEHVDILEECIHRKTFRRMKVHLEALNALIDEMKEHLELHDDVVEFSNLLLKYLSVFEKEQQQQQLRQQQQQQQLFHGGYNKSNNRHKKNTIDAMLEDYLVDTPKKFVPNRPLRSSIAREDSYVPPSDYDEDEEQQFDGADMLHDSWLALARGNEQHQHVRVVETKVLQQQLQQQQQPRPPLVPRTSLSRRASNQQNPPPQSPPFTPRSPLQGDDTNNNTYQNTTNDVTANNTNPFFLRTKVISVDNVRSQPLISRGGAIQAFLEGASGPREPISETEVEDDPIGGVDESEEVQLDENGRKLSTVSWRVLHKYLDEHHAVLLARKEKRRKKKQAALFAKRQLEAMSPDVRCKMALQKAAQTKHEHQQEADRLKASKLHRKAWREAEKKRKEDELRQLHEMQAEQRRLQRKKVKDRMVLAGGAAAENEDPSTTSCGGENRKGSLVSNEPYTRQATDDHVQDLVTQALKEISRNNAAVRIQVFLTYYMNKKRKILQNRKVMLAALRVVQCCGRGMLARVRLIPDWLNYDMARKIQSLWRSHKARSSYSAKQEARDNYYTNTVLRKDTDAAVIMQRIGRVYISKHRVQTRALDTRLWNNIRCEEERIADVLANRPILKIVEIPMSEEAYRSIVEDVSPPPKVPCSSLDLSYISTLVQTYARSKMSFMLMAYTKGKMELECLKNLTEMVHKSRTRVPPPWVYKINLEE
eukprot:PhF_6_TR37889/c0_g1_i1/m.56551